MGTIAAAFSVAVFRQANPWIIGGIGLVGTGVIGFLLAQYYYFSRREPDALRSEHFVLIKVAMEQGLVGDDQTDLHKPEALEVETSAELVEDSDSPSLPPPQRRELKGKK